MKIQTKIDKNLVRLSIHIEGIVQGVGFRPFIYNLARSYSLCGYVLNHTKGVDIEVEGDKKKVQLFLQKIEIKSPPLAVIEKINWQELPPADYEDFEIKSSRKEKDRFLPLSPDISICDECLQELFDPRDRRYLYPFINCTNCGPRFTIIKDVPYDRQRTTMDKFKMCPDCESEYNDPSNRRFHAQPNACWRCGPGVKLLNNKGKKVQYNDPITFAAELIKKGSILAIKGIGGYHLACDGTNSRVIKKLRERKNRIDKPFALMMLDLKQIKKFCQVSQEEERLLLSPQRPIALLKRGNKNLPREIAPKNRYLGVMLPYTPLHYLLLKEVKIPLIMTSGNISEEPISYEDGDALCRLSKIADFFLLHNREIRIRVDDSVGRVVEGKPMLIRRSRGYAPQPLRVNFEARKCVLAVGGHLKNTFCFLKKDYAFISHHIGDLENLSALISLEEGIEHYERIFYCHPQIISCDLHPNYASTNLAREYARKRSLPLISVQHHHAHIVSVLAEQGIKDKVIGVVFDGSGLGSDGTLWGGEFLVADYSDFKRVGHLRPIPLPGGVGAIKEPWRMSMAYLYEIYKDKCASFAREIFPQKSKEINLVENLVKKKINSPLTSSAGRLFDAVAAILGIRERINYEGQAAVELEMLSLDEREKFYPFKIKEKEGRFIVDTLPLVEAVIEEKRKIKRELIAGRFHWTLSKIILKVCQLIREKHRLNQVVLSGGVFQNSLLLKQVVYLLKSSDFKVILPGFIPPNDGGISLGQAVIAYHQIERYNYVPCYSS
jgi:hydrogenase maturation protein HypF